MPKRGLAIGMVALLAATLLAGTPVLAAPYKPPTAAKEKPLAGSTVPPRKVEMISTGTPFKGAAPVWPKATTAEVDLGSASADMTAAVKETPISVMAAGVPLGKVKVETFDREKTRAAGVEGLLFRVSGSAAKVDVDYSPFRWAYGGDWASRLRLVELPECALRTPDKAECEATVVPSRNNTAKGVVSSAVATKSGGSLMAVTAAPSGPSGNYSATSLSPSATWSASGNTGEFTWNYPLRTPPAPGSLAPSLSLGYSSASVDGRMAATNNQPSWVGEGFEFSDNFIERRYVACLDDMANGARNTEKTGDMCWGTENATMSLAGRGSELIKDASNENRWHLRNDDGTFVERRTGADNDARNGEYWVVTTTDGTQYWFGRGKQSTQTVSVAGNHANEPCAAPAFRDSFCTQAYRWNLEYVVDLNGNTMTYSYDKETNKYARNKNESDLVQYDRNAVLKQIDYGTRAGRGDDAPMQIVFDLADRCLANCATHNATTWPDVPWEQECDKSPCRNLSPTFWSTKRLSAVATKVGGNPVEKWTFTHSFPDPGDGTRAGMWLDRISHEGLVDQSTPVPDVRFVGVQLSNRVDTHSDQHPAMKWWRVKTIFTETGGQIDVNYKKPDCVPGTRMPDANALQDNKLRCYPVKWTPEGQEKPILDFFHKYVVESITEADLTGGAPSVVTQFDHLQDPAWHYTDDDGLIKAEYKTWSVWRGYEKVRTTRGVPGEQTLTETRFFRGMHGDKLPSGARDVSLPAVAVGGVPATPDENAFAGMTREEIVYNGPGGDEVSATVNVPWQSNPTASRTINDSTVHARFVGVSAKHGRTKLDAGRGYRTTSAVTEFDQTYGMATEVEEHGDDSVAGDEKCHLTSYARNISNWNVSAVSRKRSFTVNCATARFGFGLKDSDVVGDSRTYYDNQDFGVAPTKGDVTKVETLKSYSKGVATYLADATTEYDAYGRLTKVTTPKGSSTTAYTPTAGGPVTQIVTTNPLGWATTTTMQPALQLPVSVVDSNNARTDIDYDGLGRTAAVWLPGHPKGQQPADAMFSYLVRSDRPSVVTTKKLLPNGQHRSAYQLLDGLLRPRQTQVDDVSGQSTNAVVTDVHYDSVGRTVRTNNPYVSTVAPGTELFRPTDAIPSGVVTRFDGAGRTTATILNKLVPVASPGGAELFRTTTAYTGDRTDVTPPAGGTITSTLTDVLGRTSELRQYHSGVPAGSSDPAGFDATKYEYDLRDQLKRVTTPGNFIWEYDYDLRGNKIRTADPDRGVSTSAFNDAGELESTTDARGVTLAYTYDTLGRKTFLREGSQTGPKRAEWVYDKSPDDWTFNGQLIKSIRYEGTNEYVQENKSFDAAGRPMSTVFTVPESETGLAGSYEYGYTYKTDGSPDRTVIPALGNLYREVLEYTYDDRGLPATQISGYRTYPKTGMVTATQHTSFGEVAAYTLQNSVYKQVDVLRVFDETTRRLKESLTTREVASRDVSNTKYDYDDAGNVTKIKDDVSGDNQCFRTDHLRRLTEAWTPSSGDCAVAPTVAGLGGPGKYWHSYGYNVSGDRTQLVEHGTSAGDRTTVYTPTAGKHSLASAVTTDNAGSRGGNYSYDDLGNMRTRPGPNGMQTMTWNLDGNLATSEDSTGKSSYVYDADGARMVRRDPDGSTLYLPGQELRYKKSSGAKSSTRYYAHAGETVAMRNSAGIQWVSSDHHGTAENTIAAINQAVSTRRTTPFGEVRAATGAAWPSAFDKGFVGGTLDNTGLTHIGAREYDPVLGRFISVDPILDPKDPQQMHGYVYSNSNPLAFSDPTGELHWSQCPDQDCKKSNNSSSAPVDYYYSNHGGGVSTITHLASHQTMLNGYLLGANSPPTGDVIAALRNMIEKRGGFDRAYRDGGNYYNDTARTASLLIEACKSGAGIECSDEFAKGLTVTNMTGMQPPQGENDEAWLAVGFASAGPGGMRFGTGPKPGSPQAVSAQQFFRGSKQGQPVSFVPRPNEFKIDKATGFVKDTHGVSVFDNSASVASKGLVSNRIDMSSVPSTLRVIQRGNDPRHYEIVPAIGANLTSARFTQELCKITCY